MSQPDTIRFEARTERTMPAPALRLPRRLRIALVGPDGVGKSTVIALLRESFQRDFPGSRVEVRQWRPGLLPDLGRFIGKPASQGKAQKPRRHPGRFHMLRVFYYYWDFLLGSWWKDTLTAQTGTLVIYDRCALDMQVDPVRFALRSTAGTGLLYRWSPKPELVILLQDSPARISQRKQELEPHEMAEQLLRWRELAAAGQVHAIVRVNDGPEEIAARVSHLLRDALPPETCNGTDEGLAYIDRVLAGLPDTDTDTGSAARELAVLPRRSAPRFLIPCSPRSAAMRSLDIYNPLTLLGRAWKGCIGAGFRCGMARPMLRDKVTLPLGALERFLGDVAGCENAVLSISLGTPGAHRKPVLQVMDQAGRVHAFAKIGWNDDTNALVQREAAVLAELGSHTFTTAVIPRVMHSGWLGSNYMLVLAAAPGPLRDGGCELDDRHLQFLKELNAIGAGRQTAHADALEEAGARLDSIRRGGFHYYAHLIEFAMEHMLEHSCGAAGMGHGDFAPWNIREAGGKLLVLDWEYAGRHTPRGWDLFHFLIQTALELHGAGGARIYRDLLGPTPARARIEQHFGADAQSDVVTTSLIAYLVDALSRSLVNDGQHASPVDMHARRAWAAMLSLLLNDERRAS